MLNLITMAWPLRIIVVIVGSVVLAVVSACFAMLYRGIDRKLVARMQGRVGPPIIQPFRDMQKLLMKENIVPQGAISWLFNAAPFICLVSSVLLLLYIPLFGLGAFLGEFGDTILILYLL